MSEKIYAWLLHLFPSHFREAYEEEALCLFRDRSRDEQGFWAKGRLWLDLLIDFFTSVPGEYRRVVPMLAAASGQQPSERAPAFLVLEGKSVHLRWLLLGGLVSTVSFWIIPSTVSQASYQALRDSEARMQRLDFYGPLLPRELGPRSSTGDSILIVLGNKVLGALTHSGTKVAESKTAQGNLMILLMHPEPRHSGILDTPAGQAFWMWLDAFNSGDPAKLETYVQTIDPLDTVGSELRLRRFTGGFHIREVMSSGPRFIKVLLQERNSLTRVLVSIRIAEGQPIRVLRFGRSPIPRGSAIDEVQLDSAEKQLVIQAVIAHLQRSYIYPDIGQKMAEALLANEKQGEDASETDGAAFADLLTRQMRSVSRDQHLQLRYRPYERSNTVGADVADGTDRSGSSGERYACGVERAEILPKNIGHLKLDGLGDPAECRTTIITAMRRLQKARALILDLRDNGGGSPEMVSFLCSYLFPRTTHLGDLYNRADHEGRQLWTLPPIPGNRLADKPLYVLTSLSTFSGAEELSYELKTLRGATLVGEPTGGGAPFVIPQEIDDHFILGVPSRGTINSVSETNWEGTGIQPDVEVNAVEAFEIAQKLAESRLQK